MKKIILAICAVIILLGGIGTLYRDQPTKPVDRAVNAQIPDVDLAFAVLGDIHENVDSFQKAIDDLHAINPAMDALVLNGDTVDQGLEKQYNSIKKVLNKNESLLPKTLIRNIGNHEFFNYEIEKNSPEDVKAFINRYLELAGEEKVYHDTWVKGYHFISMGSEDGNSETLDSVRAYISKEQLKWLKERLAEKYEKGKPIFVFLHQHLNSNPKNGWVGSDQSDEIRDILSQYPEVILFSSHTHRNLDNTSVTLNQPFTMVHTGAVHYTIIRDPNGKSTREPYIKGLYLEVKGNKVVIKGRDLKEKSWIFTQEISKQPK
ncbi:MAG: metallophosphoesterase [Desulfitobacterium hafniense]|nr:metallophosphoesterase [Desulfitobacterium hafniense]